MAFYWNNHLKAGDPVYLMGRPLQREWKGRNVIWVKGVVAKICAKRIKVFNEELGEFRYYARKNVFVRNVDPVSLVDAILGEEK